MGETKQQVSQIYLQQIYEAVTQFVHSQVEYTVMGVDERLKQVGQKIETSPEKKAEIQSYINRMRTFELHSFQRLFVLKENGLDLKNLEEKRKTLYNSRIPDGPLVEELALEYLKILATKLTDNLLITPQQMAGELTGKL